MTNEEFTWLMQQNGITGGQSGQHWYSGSQVYGSALGQSGLSPLGTNAQNYAQLANTYVAQQNAINQAIAAQSFQSFAQQGTRAKPVKHEGIRTGEIIGYRCWQVHEGWLSALTQDVIWVPGETMKGDVSKYGVYAFDLMGRALGEIVGGEYRYPTVAGSVQMWGEVIEHEFGYRSEFAKIVSLDYIQGADESVLQGLRVKYGLVDETVP